MLFSITAVDSMLYDVASFPEWFKIGCFEPLHRDSLPAAKVYYAKYLYAVGYAVATKQLELPGVQGLALMGILPHLGRSFGTKAHCFGPCGVGASQAVL